MDSQWENARMTERSLFWCKTRARQCLRSGAFGRSAATVRLWVCQVINTSNSHRHAPLNAFAELRINWGIMKMKHWIMPRQWESVRQCVAMTTSVAVRLRFMRESEQPDDDGIDRLADGQRLDEFPSGLRSRGYSKVAFWFRGTFDPWFCSSFINSETIHHSNGREQHSLRSFASETNRSRKTTEKKRDGNNRKRKTTTKKKNNINISHRHRCDTATTTTTMVIHGKTRSRKVIGLFECERTEWRMMVCTLCAC